MNLPRRSLNTSSPSRLRLISKPSPRGHSAARMTHLPTCVIIALRKQEPQRTRGGFSLRFCPKFCISPPDREPAHFSQRCDDDQRFAITDWRRPSDRRSGISLSQPLPDGTYQSIRALRAETGRTPDRWTMRGFCACRLDPRDCRRKRLRGV